MTWPDFVVIVLCIALGLVESKRGFVVAFFDMIGCVLIVEISGSTYQRFVSPSMSYAGAYVMCVVIGIVVIGALTTVLQRQTRMDIGSFDNSLAGALGIVCALILSHAMYGAVILAEPRGMQSAVYQGSAFAGQIYELRTWHSFMGFMGRVGTADVAK